MATLENTQTTAASIGYNGQVTAAIKVTDLTASIDWYQKVLGFTLLYRVDEIAWCEMSCPVQGLQIGLSQVESVPAAGGTTLTFGVNDIEVARGKVEAHSVRFDGPTLEIPNMVKLATFFDPDGNTLMLSQSLSEMP